MNKIKEFLLFFWNDFKTDIKFIFHVAKCLITGKPILRPEFKAELKAQFAPGWLTQTLKNYWPMFLMFALFFICGYWYAMQRCSETCNGALMDYFKEQAKKSAVNAFNYSLEAFK